MRHELLHAFRRLARTPASTAAATATLAVGLAAVLVVFVVARQLVFRSSALPSAPRVTLLELDARAGDAHQRLAYWSYPAYEAARDALAPDQTLVAATLDPLMLTLGAAAGAQRVATEAVSAGYFEALGVAPALGRTLVGSDDERGDAQRIWLEHSLWRDGYGADPAILGRVVPVEGHAFVVAGVLPPGFRGLSETARAWIPMAATPAVTFARRLEGRTSFWHQVFAVPEDAAARASIDARLPVAARRVEAATGLVLEGRPAQFELVPRPWLELRVDPVLRRSTLAFGAGALLLLAIVVGNLVLLTLARTDARRDELAVRTALGAPRHRLVRDLAAELALVYTAGLVLAVALAAGALAVLRRYDELVAVGGATLADLELHGVALAIVPAMAVFALAATLIGPARALLRIAPGTVLVRHGERVAGSDRRGLAAAQLALATALTVGATLSGTAAWRAMHAPLGIDPARVLTAQVAIPRAVQSDQGLRDFLARMQAGLAAIPGVEHAASAYCLPVRGGCDQVLFEAVPRADESEWPVALNMVGGDYFAALGIPVLEGRGFDARDDAAGEPVVVLSAGAARAYFPDGSAIGRSVKVSVGWPERAEGARVVGVVGDVLGASVDQDPAPMLYLPAAQFAYADNLAIVRAQPGHAAASLGPALHATLVGIAPDYALFDVATMDERFDGLTARRRFAAQMIAALAALAVALALTGTYAVFDLIVRRRRREFGVRLALGASAQRLRRSVLGAAIRVAVASSLLGAGAAVVASRALASSLPDLARAAEAQALLVALAMATLAVLATWLPSRAASRVDPIESLREP